MAPSRTIAPPSLYKHYKGKQDIFDAIFAEMQRRYDEQAEKMQLHITDAAADRNRFAFIDAEELIHQVQALVRYSLHDEYVSRFRRLMTIGQFCSPALSVLYTRRYVVRMVEYHENLFAGLMSAGALRGGDPHSMALQYTCPILTLLSVCDRHPEAEEQAMTQIEAHIRQFWALTRPGK